MNKFGEVSEPMSKTEIVSPVQNMRETKLVGKIRKIPGLKIWQLNLKTLEILPAEMDVQVTLDGGTKSKVITQTGFSYCQALNVKNAERKFTASIRKQLSKIAAKNG